MASQNVKMGLISFGVVFGIGVVIISIVLIASSPSSGGRKGAFQPPSASSASSGDLAEIQNHKWWTRPLKESEVRAMIDKIVSANRDSFFWAKQNGQILLQPPGHQNGLPEVVLTPEAMEDGKRLYIHIQGYQRYTESDAISALVAALNRVEFRDGAGRK